MITIFKFRIYCGEGWLVFRNMAEEDIAAKKKQLLGLKNVEEVKEVETYATNEVIVRIEPKQCHWAWHVSVPVRGTGLEFTGIVPHTSSFLPRKWDIVVEVKEGEPIEGCYCED